MFWIKNSAADWIEYYWHLCYNLLSPKFVILKQSLQREQIICICADICTFPDLHYRHEQTSAPFDKVSIWSKERAERTVPSLGGHCKQANSAIFCSPLWPQTFMQTLRILCRYCADFRAFVATWALSHLRAFLVWFWCRLLCRHWGFCADIVQISARKNARWNLWALPYIWLDTWLDFQILWCVSPRLPVAVCKALTKMVEILRSSRIWIDLGGQFVFSNSMLCNTWI